MLAEIKERKVSGNISKVNLMFSILSILIMPYFKNNITKLGGGGKSRRPMLAIALHHQHNLIFCELLKS
jgi:hypothetical protein